MQFAQTNRITTELASKQVLMLFPTPIFTGMLPDVALCDRIEDFVRAVRRSGRGHSAPERASPVYMTPDNLHHAPEMRELVDIVLRETGMVLDAYAIKRNSHYITSMWANITHPNNRQNMHVHPNCVLSGLVYIKTPPNCGPTMFVSPRRLTKNFEPNYVQRNDLNSDFFIVPAEKGRMLIWPGHIPHAVEAGTADADEDRITLPFNVMIRARIEMFTASLDIS
jgi:uncharacterized protein (TIGR02466 family)